MFTVFKAYGRLSGEAYYGYSRLEDVKAGFLQGAKRCGLDRKDNLMLRLNAGDEKNIMIEELYYFEDEVQAWACRNDLRAASIDSISGPTMFPGALFNRIKKDEPERAKEWKVAFERKSAKTAREAWQKGRWTKEQVKALLDNHKRSEVVSDLDRCTPSDFAKKYSLA